MASIEKDELRGRRVLICEDHPWVNHTGTLLGCFRIVTGEWAVEVELDNGQKTAIDHPGQIKFLPLPKN